jgi:hypothetical protein
MYFNAEDITIAPLSVILLEDKLKDSSEHIFNLSEICTGSLFDEARL